MVRHTPWTRLLWRRESDDEVDEHRRSREQREFNEATYADGRISDQTDLIGTFQHFIKSDGNKFAMKLIPISVAGYVQVNVYIRGVLITPQFRRREFRRIAKRVETRQVKFLDSFFTAMKKVKRFWKTDQNCGDDDSAIDTVLPLLLLMWRKKKQY